MTRARPGDLVFRYRGETSFSRAVSAVVRGWGGLAVDHVGLYEGDGWVWEAGHGGVRRVQATTWEGGLLVGRLSKATRANHPDLAERLFRWVREREGLPYNDTFDQGKTSYYCSELVIDAFRQAGAALFHETPLTFRDATGQTLPYWEQYYRDRGRAVPEGEPGSHPAHLSLSPELTVEKV